MKSLSCQTRMLPYVPFLLTSLLPTPAQAWGALGHETIAYIASSYLSSTTEQALQTILSSTSADYLANVSTWADSYRYTSAGAWSKPLHFIDANDNPPTSCSVDFDRDCGTSGCSVSAVQNYTSIMLDTTVSDSGLLDATRFLVHFVGDLHQPLHDEAIDLGGNEIAITYNGQATNLHHIWDTEIVEAIAGTTSSSLSAAQTFATTLLDSIDNGDYGWNSSAWIDGISLDDVLGTVMGWAEQANSYVCSDVLVGGVSAVETGDLAGAYTTKHEAVARIQIARAGVRLGAWLNLIVTGNVDG